MSNFGVDLLFETQKGNIHSENDALIIVIHWVLCKNNFRSVGVGDNVRKLWNSLIKVHFNSFWVLQKIFSDEDRPTELLPQGWNQNQASYTLRYTLNKNIYILYGIVSDDTLIVNLLDAKTLKTVGLVFKAKEVIKSLVGMTLDDYVHNSQTIINKMNDDIVKPILDQNPERRTGSTSRAPRNDDPLLVRPVVPPMYQDRRFDPLRDPLRDIGRGDLDPFGRGGGSIFQPEFRPEFGPVNPFRPPGSVL